MSSFLRLPILRVQIVGGGFPWAVVLVGIFTLTAALGGAWLANRLNLKSQREERRLGWRKDAYLVINEYVSQGYRYAVWRIINTGFRWSSQQARPDLPHVDSKSESVGTLLASKPVREQMAEYNRELAVTLNLEAQYDQILASAEQGATPVPGELNRVMTELRASSTRLRDLSDAIFDLMSSELEGHERSANHPVKS